MVTEEKQHGQTYTPEQISKFLTRWAVKSPEDLILEPSVGEGQFVFDAQDRLMQLGAGKEESQQSIYGMDIDSEAISTLQKRAKTELGNEFPNVTVGNLFDSDLPKVDAVIGNPPYVIRHRFENPDKIIEQYSNQLDFSDQADLYVYFIVRALESLEPEGRFAMIVSNSWMKKKYGKEFKEYLLRELDIKALIGFQERVFPDKLVNSVCILAEKRPNTIRIPDKDSKTKFIQIERADLLEGIEDIEALEKKAVQSASVPQPYLEPEDYWDIWLRAPDIFDVIYSNGKFTDLSEFAKPMIGVQTLAKDFYVLSDETPEKDEIEDEYLRPLAYSPRDHQNPVLTDDCEYRIFWCSKPKSQLEGTRALEYIEEAENRTVEKRYSDETYDGLDNKKRIKQANRSPWYNLTEEADRRLPSQILIPRRVYENYTAVWNKSGAVPNENFLATTVERDEYVKPLLCYLNSSLGELCLRLSGHVYGGGVCDLNVSSAKEIQTLDLSKLDDAQLQILSSAFDEFVETRDRGKLNEAVYEILEFTSHEKTEVEDALQVAIEESLSK
jgi:tRNA1(Val) A37 N6-methylase TrmN6